MRTRKKLIAAILPPEISSTSGLEKLHRFGRGPTQHLAEDQGGPLAGRQMLQCGHEGPTDRFAVQGDLGRIGTVQRRDAVVSHGADPGALREDWAKMRLIRR